MNTQPSDPAAALDRLDGFFREVNEAVLPADDARARELRECALADLRLLLMWERSWLERSCGLDWPYRRLRQAEPVLERLAGRNGEKARQAGLHLALLPFPGQFIRLQRMTAARTREPEVLELAAAERDKAARKIAKKGQKGFKLRHFCQVLKAPGSKADKGVLRIFSMPYAFMDEALLSRIRARYVLYLEPTMGVFMRHTYLRRFCDGPEPALVGTSGAEDAAFLDTQPGLVPVRLAHTDFVPDEGPPPVADKNRDLVFNGTFDEMDRKRHFFLLDLLETAPLAQATALVLGRGRTDQVERFCSEVWRRGLESRVETVANVRRDEVPRLLARCRLGVHLSLDENGPRCVSEYFRADLPCVISSATAGVNFDHFTPQTGRVASDHDLPAATAEVLGRRHEFSPRTWFVAQSGSVNASRRLNEFVENFFAEHGLDFGSGLVRLLASGASRYANQEDYERFSPEHQWLAQELARSGVPIELMD